MESSLKQCIKGKNDCIVLEDTWRIVVKVIYHCFGGSHSSVIAAALHLGLLEKHRLPTRQELMALPYFDKTHDEDFGTIRFMGVDSSANEIYVLGRKSMGDRYSQMITGVAKILGADGQVMAVDCMSRVNIFMKIGGFFSRRIGLVFPGRYILIRGSRMAFMNLVNLIETIRLKSLKV